MLAANLINAQLSKFKVSFLEPYDGNGYPNQHLQNYRTAMRLHGAIGLLMCLTFPTTLWKASMEWFNNIQRGSIILFRNLAYAFINQFSYTKKQKMNKASFLFVAQKKEENLREYIQRFNKKRLEVGMCSDNVAMAAFTTCIKKRKNKDLIRSLYHTSLENFDSMMCRAKGYIFADEALDSLDDEEQETFKK